jgi:alginate O-acetyltransferase complex protein AlgI
MHGRFIERHRGTSKAKLGLALSLIVNLGLLGFFKYAGFFVDCLNAVLPFDLTVPSVRLPLGISFYTFQTLTYIIDVYRGRVKSRKSYRDYLLYLSLYPQLVAGPIVRYADVSSELESRTSSRDDIAYGILRFCIGLGKKVILANGAGQLCAPILDGNLSALCVAEAWYGIILFALQIYFDFSGYSDMAIGLARIFGFHYYENFRYPYLSRSVSEFWRR